MSCVAKRLKHDTNEVMSAARVRVPATIANLGPGFDALGLAVSLYLTANATLEEHDSFSYNGDANAFGADNLMHQGWREAHRAMGMVAPHVQLSCENPIPLARGLGSSSAALVAGAALADAVQSGRLGREGVLRVCTELEGHPDNVAPAVLGGFTASVMGEHDFLNASFNLPDDVHVLVAVPDFELKTSEARAALPDQYSRADMVFNLSRSALWVAAVASGNLTWLREACRDRLHQPYRAAFVPGLEATIEAALDRGALAAFLSGAGPSLGALVTADTLEAVTATLKTFSSQVLHLRPSAGYETLETFSSPPLEVSRGR
jgi:homoserine kinase